MARFVLIGVLSAALPLFVPARAAAKPSAARDVEFGVASGMEKLHPSSDVPRARTIELAAARGECESAQVAVRARRGLSALSAEAAPLSGSSRIEVALYRVVTLDLARPSGPDGRAGAWPDPLVPARDAWFGEERRAFPIRVPPRELQSIWVEVCVPRSAAAGSWRGQVALRDGESVVARVPVQLQVWPFEIPATSSMPVTFGLSTRLATQALGAPMDPELSRALAAAALRHRISPHGLSHDPPSGRCTEEGCRFDWSAYDAEMAPLLDGKLVPGARATWAEARISRATWEGPEPVLRETLRAWRRHFEERGWADRLWVYTLDEPRPEQYDELRRRARVAKEAGVRMFVTHEPVRALDGIMGALAPNVVFFDRGALRELATPSHRSSQTRPFWYVSCLSHGCDEIPAGAARAPFVAQFSGWPGYEIDRPSAAARAMGWLAWREQVAGELYFDMIQTWRQDPWRDPRAFAGNGDGTLLYPGTVERWGGTRAFPVESIRLKVIRDGLEDLELLRLAERAGLRDEAQRIAARVAPSLRGFSRSPDAWLQARAELARALSRRLAATASRAER